MKKLLVIFGIFYGLMPSANAGKYYGCSGPQKEYKQDHAFWDWDYDLFCYFTNDKWACFKSDSDYCPDGTIVCILGSDNKGRKPEGYGVVFGSAVCRWAKDRSEDTWKLTKPTIDGEYYRNIDDCNDTKWHRNDGIGKDSTVLVTDGVAHISADGDPIQFKIYPRDTYKDAAPAHPNICIGYYCKDGNGKYTEPCDDGTCGSNCTETSDTTPDSKFASLSTSPSTTSTASASSTSSSSYSSSSSSSTSVSYVGAAAGYLSRLGSMCEQMKPKK